MKTCPVCQNLVNDDTKFCYYCGASLMTPAAAPAPEPEPAPAEPAPEPAPVEPEPQPVEEPVVSEPEPAADPEPIVIPEPEPEPQPVPEPQPIVIPTPQPEPKPAEQPAPEPVHQPEPVRQLEPAPAAPPAPPVYATDSRSLMSTAGYIFSTILFHIPVIGIIFLFIWGCGRPKNISLKRYALAWLIMRLLGVILVLSFAVFMLICYSGKFPILTDAFVRFFS